MIDNLALGLTHGLMMLTAWLLLKRPDLDTESPPPRQWRGRTGRGGTGHARTGQPPRA